MDFDNIQDIREIVHGLGEKKQRKDTMATIHFVLIKQMALMIFQAHRAPYHCNKTDISIKDVIFVLRDYKFTVLRLSRYYLIKENIYKYTAVNSLENQELPNKFGNNDSKFKLNNDVQLFYSDIAEASDLNLNDSINLDPITTLAKHCTSQPNRRNKKKKCIYFNILNATMELKLDTFTSEEDVRNATHARNIRVNELAIRLSPIAYDGFRICRTRVFHNNLGELLLKKVHNILPMNVNYKDEVKHMLLTLAKETIACLIDRVHENRKKSTATEEPASIDIPNKDNSKPCINTHEPISVEEITAITTMVWNRSLGDIQTPFQENDKFLNSPLIFD